MIFTARTLTCMALLLAPFSIFANTLKDPGPIELEILNKTSYPLNVFQGKKKAVVSPDDRFQATDYKNATITISTSDPEAAIRFISLSNTKGCKAQTCVLITGK